jgi:excisionase family DNA binding protein
VHNFRDLAQKVSFRLACIPQDFLGPLKRGACLRKPNMHIEKGVPVTFKVHEVAKILNCSRSQVYVLIKSGELEGARIRGSRRVTENQLVRYIRRIEGS